MVYHRGCQPAALGPPAALCLASYGPWTHIDVCVSDICLLPLSSIRYIPVRGKYGGDVHASPFVWCGSLWCHSRKCGYYPLTGWPHLIYHNKNGQIINSLKFYRECIILWSGIITFSAISKFLCYYDFFWYSTLTSRHTEFLWNLQNFLKVVEKSPKFS